MPLLWHKKSVLWGLANFDPKKYTRINLSWFPYPSIRLLSDKYSIHIFRFQNDLKISYMDSYEDWLKLYNIKPPVDYIGEDSILSQIAVENNYEFVKINRRPPICGGFISNHQLLGPHVVLTFNETSRQISSKILPGEIKVFSNKVLQWALFMLGIWYLACLGQIYSRVRNRCSPLIKHSLWKIWQKE